MGNWRREFQLVLCCTAVGALLGFLTGLPLTFQRMREVPPGIVYCPGGTKTVVRFPIRFTTRQSPRLNAVTAPKWIQATGELVVDHSHPDYWTSREFHGVVEVLAREMPFGGGPADIAFHFSEIEGPIRVIVQTDNSGDCSMWMQQHIHWYFPYTGSGIVVGMVVTIGISAIRRWKTTKRKSAQPKQSANAP